MNRLKLFGVVFVMVVVSVVGLAGLNYTAQPAKALPVMGEEVGPADPGFYLVQGGSTAVSDELTTPQRRTLVKVFLKDREARERRGDRKDLLRRILRDDDLIDVVTIYAELEQSTPDAPQAENPVINFLQWLLDNQDAIIAFIQKIIALFEDIQPDAYWQPAPQHWVYWDCCDKHKQDQDQEKGVYWIAA